MSLARSRSLSEGFMVPGFPRNIKSERSKSASHLAYERHRRSTAHSFGTGTSEPKVIEEDEDDDRLIRSKKDLLILIGLAVSYFNANSAFSMIAPFFPLEGKKKNMDDTLTGLVFAVYPLVVFFVSPLIGKWIPKLGVKFTLVAGCFLQGGCSILFGCLDFVDDDTQFTIYCFILRVVMAAGAAASETACVCMTTVIFKHRLSIAQGIMSCCSGAGLMVGPAVGGILYKIGGFQLPLISVGCFVWVILSINVFVLPEESVYFEEFVGEERDRKSVGFLKVFMVPGVAVMSTVTLTAGMIISFLDPTLTNHVEKVTNNGVGSDVIGLIFLSTPFTYTIVTPFLGCLIDKKVRGRYVTIAGAFLGFICYLFIGPCPLLSPLIKPHLWLIVVSLLALGAFSITSMFVPVLNDMQTSVREAGLPLGLGTDSILSGIYTAYFNMGSVIGPTLGGFLTDRLSFAWASSIFAAILLFEGLILLLFTIYEKAAGKNGDYDSLAEDQLSGDAKPITV